jgi:hypothetical protein
MVSEAWCCFPKDVLEMAFFRLPFFSISLSLFPPNDSLVDHPLEIFIVSVEKLKLNLIVESIQECILFLLIGVDIVRRIP